MFQYYMHVHAILRVRDDNQVKLTMCTDTDTNLMYVFATANKSGTAVIQGTQPLFCTRLLGDVVSLSTAKAALDIWLFVLLLLFLFLFDFSN